MTFSMRWVAAAACTALALTGCSGQANTPESAAQDVPATAQAVYEQTIHAVYGTAEQRQAGAEAGWLRTQIAIRDCMTGKGQKYVPAPFQAFPDDGVAPGDLLAFAPTRADFGYGRAVLAGAKTGTANPAGKDVTAALNACSEGATDDTSRPADQGALEALLVEALAAVQTKALPKLAETYPACLDKAGMPAADLSDLYMKVTLNYPAVSYEKPSDPTKLKGWDTAVAFESKAAATDAACRAGVTDTAVEAAKPVLAEFTTKNAAQIKAVSEGWVKVGADLSDLRAKVAA